MLEPPDLADEAILTCVSEAYRIKPAALTFLPIGNDPRAWVFRLSDRDQTYFLKVRRGGVNAASLVVPRFLFEQRIRQVVAPLPAHSGALWQPIGDYSIILYPYVDGRSGGAGGLSDSQWFEFGDVLRRIHGTRINGALAGVLKRETFRVKYPDVVRDIDAQAALAAHGSIEQEFAQVWSQRRNEISAVVERAVQLGEVLSQTPRDPVLCHGDIHVYNTLIDSADRFFIIDWDETVLAPKERDLMFVGSNIGGTLSHNPQFDVGYGPAGVDLIVLAYYRYEWAVQEVAEYGRCVLSDEFGEITKRDALVSFRRLFEPGEDFDLAYRAGAKPGSGA